MNSYLTEVYEKGSGYTQSYIDKMISKGYSIFKIHEIGDKIYVTYVKNN